MTEVGVLIDQRRAAFDCKSALAAVSHVNRFVIDPFRARSADRGRSGRSRIVSEVTAVAVRLTPAGDGHGTGIAGGLSDDVFHCYRVQPIVRIRRGDLAGENDGRRGWWDEAKGEDDEDEDGKRSTGVRVGEHEGSLSLLSDSGV